jgi:sterol desaturase/sphingolipid hydroxylase (fatty acid hydroxylase superfamily)
MKDIILYALGLHLGIYWLFSFIFFILDLKYLDSTHNNWRKYKKGAIGSLLNQIFITIPITLLLKVNIINAFESSTNDSVGLTLIKIFLIANLSNIFFYLSHYLLHTKLLFKLIHYKHHEFIEPIAVAAVYAHPLEHLVTNVLSFIIPFILIGTNYIAGIILVCIGTFITIHAHCTYTIFNMKNEHLIHHKLFKYNYGFGGYLDWFFNTYK